MVKSEMVNFYLEANILSSLLYFYDVADLKTLFLIDAEFDTPSALTS